MSLQTFFSAGPVERNAAQRHDDAALAQLLTATDTRYIVTWQSRCMITNGDIVLLERHALGCGWRDEHAIYLGLLRGQHVFAGALSQNEALPADGPDADSFADHGSLLAMADADAGAVLAYAKGMLEWQHRHRYCGQCGAVNRPEQGGFVAVCSNEACSNRAFPRVDPAIIVLVTQGERCLLGRQAGWPERRFSTIAGFVEPGESLEDAVRREVAEETNVMVGGVSYLGSQPWPFPSAMMVGFHAEGLSTGIVLNDNELTEAGWFTRGELARGAVQLPPENSIAFRLIEAWFDQWGGPPLASLELSSSFSRSSGGG